jgi:heterotetrameric sarcosine oxidase gamma subunit
MADARILRLQGKDLGVVQDAPTAAIVRLRSASPAMLQALGEAFSLAWSDAPNVCVRAAGAELCWLGPGEWALIGPAFDQIERAVAAHCAGAVHHVADMTGAWARWRLSGKAAEDLLARGCSLDLESFDASRATRSLLGQVNIVLVRQEAGWDVYAEHALAAHVRAWFLRAGRTFELYEVRET